MDKSFGVAQVIRSTAAELEAIEVTGVDVVVSSIANTVVDLLCHCTGKP